MEYLILFEYIIYIISINNNHFTIYNIYISCTLYKYKLRRGGKIMLWIYDYERILNGKIKEVK